ncbi:hypothetical protein PsorP6_014606 [Peronosclerospora sorghi]|uniref:Uncharacterized protein n=1 Tax=Peronosclerospora sorghi TaxID=230839 RepID=A0ACC0VV66_9STRA|nr:hypothetical protein PsorP6_014606 [Peronosclerospora sorghi]
MIKNALYEPQLVSILLLDFMGSTLFYIFGVHRFKGLHVFIDIAPHGLPIKLLSDACGGMCGGSPVVRQFVSREIRRV